METPPAKSASPRGNRSGSRLSRRRFAAGVALGAAGSAALGAGLIGARGGRVTAQDAATPIAAPGRFVEPSVRLSMNGLLDTTLSAAPDATDGPGRMTYDGELPGPTLRFRPGDTLKLRLQNDLGGDITNLHVHGLHVSPRDNGDNVFVHVMPGESFSYEYQIPDDHPAGLFWYHPHSHGDSMQQVAGGLAGAMIIEGGLDNLPGIQGLPERLMVLHGPFFGTTGIEYLVNGQVNPEVEIRPGETQRWRILNASANNFFNLQLTGHPFHRIAIDGNPLPAPLTIDLMLLGPGERADCLIQGGTAGSYELRSLAWGERGQAQPDFLVAMMTVAGEAETPAPLPTTLIPMAEPHIDLSSVPIDRQRIITFEEASDAPYFSIDGKAFDADRVDPTVNLGATEEWIIRSNNPDWHPFHIHVNDFQVMSINGEPQPAHYEDTTPVPGNGEVVIRTRFLDFTGKFVYHCHILGHEDAGMMGVVEVVEGANGATPIVFPAATPGT